MAVAPLSKSECMLASRPPQKHKYPLHIPKSTLALLTFSLILNCPHLLRS